MFPLSTIWDIWISKYFINWLMPQLTMLPANFVIPAFACIHLLSMSNGLCAIWGLRVLRSTHPCILLPTTCSNKPTCKFHISPLPSMHYQVHLCEFHVVAWYFGYILKQLFFLASGENSKGSQLAFSSSTSSWIHTRDASRSLWALSWFPTFYFVWVFSFFNFPIGFVFSFRMHASASTFTSCQRWMYQT